MEVKRAVEELLPMWTEIDTDDAPELLGPGIVDPRVRAFVARQLARADDDASAVSVLGMRCDLLWN
jgi:phosphatidylinositol 3-kinase